MDNGDSRFPYPRFLRVPFVFIPKGSPPPVEWMAAHPNYVTISAIFVPRRQPQADFEPQPEAEWHFRSQPEQSASEEAAAKPEVDLTSPSETSAG